MFGLLVRMRRVRPISKKVADDVWVNTGNDTNTKVKLLRQVARLYNLAENDLVFSLVPIKEESDY